MNKLTLKPSLHSDNNGYIHCDFMLLIDGERLEHHVTDPFDLLYLFKDREWIADPLDQYVYLWTCGCGEPGCAGIAECKILKREDGRVSIGIPQPVSHYAFSSGNTSETYDSGYTRWKTEHRVKLCVFDLIQVKEELLRFAQEARELTKGVDLWSWGGGHIRYEEDEALFDLPTELEEALKEL